jgi:lauroyl/myristoyl acyltransferase
LGDECLRWEISGAEHLKELEDRKTGAVLLTAHMGNYDVAAPLFAQKIHRPIHMVRAPERHRKTQELEHEKREQDMSANFVVHYNEPGNMLGVTLARAIVEGGIVAVQGDRVLFDVSPMKVPFDEGVEWQVPRGPFVLALVAKTVIHPVFIIRLGWRSYRVHAHPAIDLPLQDRERERVLTDAAMQWTSAVRRVGQRYWWQWFVLEDMFENGARAAEVRSQRPDVGSGPAEENVKVDSVIPSRSGRSAATECLWNALAGGWTSAVVLRRLLEWAVGDCMRVAGAIIGWPAVWLVAMVLIVITVLLAAALLARLLLLPAKKSVVIACGLMLATFGGVAWSELRGGCSVGWWLSALGFAGIGAGLLQEIISRMVRK